MTFSHISERHSRRNPAVRLFGSAALAFLSTASPLTWSSSLPQLWHGGGAGEEKQNKAGVIHFSQYLKLAEIIMYSITGESYDLVMDPATWTASWHVPSWVHTCQTHVYPPTCLIPIQRVPADGGHCVCQLNRAVHSVSMSNNPLCIQLSI